MTLRGSLYFHAPFCRRKCGYCHFYVTRDDEAAKDAWVAGILAEWAAKRHLVTQLSSVYFGGGTPSLLGPERIGQILVALRPLDPREVTLEANPESASDFATWCSVGVNRLSFGVQSFSDTLLPTLDRDHSAEQAVQAIEGAHDAGFQNISIDLMYDLPGLTLEQWRNTLARAISLPISHLSLYNLTIEPGTAFHRRGVELPPSDTSAQMLDLAVETLHPHLPRYEISAFGRPSIHNVGYWQGRPFLGFGPSAFSDWEGRRFRNVANLKRWQRKVMAGEDPVDFSEQLPPERRAREMLAIGLRMIAGVPYCESPEILRLIDQGFLERSGSRLRLTQRGLLFYDTVATELV